MEIEITCIVCNRFNTPRDAGNRRFSANSEDMSTRHLGFRGLRLDDLLLSIVERSAAWKRFTGLVSVHFAGARPSSNGETALARVLTKRSLARVNEKAVLRGPGVGSAVRRS